MPEFQHPHHSDSSNIVSLSISHAGWDEGWKPPVIQAWFDYPWDDVPLEVKTEGSVGSEEMISFEVRGSDKQGIARVEVKLDQDPHFFVEFCQNEKNLVNLPSEDRRIWTFIKHGLEGVSIECNGVEVGRIMFKDSTIPQHCLVSKWTTVKVAGVHFNTAEEASKGIRGLLI